MTKNYLRSVAITGIIIAGTSEAKGFMTKNLDRLIDRAAKAHSATRIDPDNCATLAGHWVGQCVNRKDPNVVEAESITIVQLDCTQLTLDSFDVPNHGSFTAQKSVHSQSISNLNASISLTGSWNDAQTRFTTVDLVSVPALGLNFIDSRYFELDGETLVVSDGDNVLILDETGGPSPWRKDRSDCRFTRQK